MKELNRIQLLKITGGDGGPGDTEIIDATIIHNSEHLGDFHID
jgi:hypothetical protein